MTTTPYQAVPVGADTVDLRVHIPYGCQASAMTISENDGSFTMVDEDSGDRINSTLHSSSAVAQNYEGATTQTANSAFAVQIGGSDLSSGVSKTNLEGLTTYVCSVSSYKSVNKYEISDGPDGPNGLKLNLGLSGITRDGASVGGGNMQAASNGELRIRAVPLESEVIPPLTGMKEKEEGGVMWILVSIGITMSAMYIAVRRRWRMGYGK